MFHPCVALTDDILELFATGSLLDTALGYGTARGPGKVEQATEKAIAAMHVGRRGLVRLPQAVLVDVKGDESMPLRAINDVCDQLDRGLRFHKDVAVICTFGIDDELVDEIQVWVVAKDVLRVVQD